VIKSKAFAAATTGSAAALAYQLVVMTAAAAVTATKLIFPRALMGAISVARPCRPVHDM